MKEPSEVKFYSFKSNLEKQKNQNWKVFLIGSFSFICALNSNNKDKYVSDTDIFGNCISTILGYGNFKNNETKDILKHWVIYNFH